MTSLQYTNMSHWAHIPGWSKCEEGCQRASTSSARAQLLLLSGARERAFRSISCDLKMEKMKCLDSARILKLEASKPSGEERGEFVRQRCLVSKRSLQQQFRCLFCVRDMDTDDSSPLGWRRDTSPNCDEEVVSLQPMIPPKRFDIFSPWLGDAQKV